MRTIRRSSSRANREAVTAPEATFLDETGNAAQARATFTFGPLCGLSVTEGTSITYVSLSSFRAYTDGSQVRVQWETFGEAGTVGFVLTRLNELSGKYEPVHNGRIRALMTGAQGGTYSIIDSGAVPGGQYTYQLIEIQSNGGRRRYGPFEVSVDGKPADLGNVSRRDSTDAASRHSELPGSSLEEPRGSVRKPHRILKQPRLRPSKPLRRASRLWPKTKPRRPGQSASWQSRKMASTN